MQVACPCDLVPRYDGTSVEPSFSPRAAFESIKG